MSQAARRVAIARELGCAVRRAPNVTMGGEDFGALAIEARDNAHAIELLNALASDDAQHDPTVHDLAWRFVRWVDTRAVDHQHRDLHLARKIHAFVRTSVRFQPEPTETFRGAALTLKLGAGDCDDHALVVAALARAAGLSATIVGVPNAEGEIAHVATKITVDGVPRWAETTIAAAFGEAPATAAVRLGLVRKDITG